MTVTMTVHELLRLPHHPDWKYELFDGELVWSHWPRPLPCARVSAPVSGQSTLVSVQGLTGDDLLDVREFLVKAWRTLDPYRSAPTKEEAEADIRYCFDRYLPSFGPRAPVAGLVARRKSEVVGFVQLDRGDGRYYDGLIGLQLSWLTVARELRRRGVARSLLAAAVEVATAERHGHVLSHFSAASIAGIMWHLRNGFQVLPGFRELRYDEDRPWYDVPVAAG